MPYAFAATYGIVLATASVFFLARHLQSGRRRDQFFACALLALTALCKLEGLFAAAVVHALFLVINVRTRQISMRTVIGAYAMALVVTAAVYGWFYARAGSSLLDDNLLFAGNLSAGTYVLHRSGLDDIPNSLSELAPSA